MTSSVKYTAENKVTIIYDLVLGDGTHLSNQKACTSGKSLGLEVYYQRTRDNDNGYRHWHDPDAQLFDWLANEVWEHYGSDNAAYAAGAAATNGTVMVVDGQGPCRSCRGVFRGFMREFPLVTVTVDYPKYDAKLLSDGLGGGAYGYGDAVEVKGMWHKVL